MFIHQEFMRLQKHKSVEKIICVNSDAFFVVRKRGESLPFSGQPEIFGNFRREYGEGEENEIEEFYALNSRTYTLKLASGKTVTKAMGYDLTYDNCALNFETFKELLLQKFTGCGSESIEVTQRRTKRKSIHVTQYNFTSDIAKKRKIEMGPNEVVSKPWGYKKKENVKKK